MAFPIIDSAVPMPATVAPGGKFVVSIVARDPDARMIAIEAAAVDSQGNRTAQALTLTIADPIRYEATSSVAGFVAVERPGSPGIFDCTAPA